VTGTTAHTLATDDPRLEGDHSLTKLTLAPFASVVAEIQ
jgi:hypothetical protein